MTLTETGLGEPRGALFTSRAHSKRYFAVVFSFVSVSEAVTLRD